MIGKDDVRDFLMSRRANVTPGQAGLPQDGGDRRVPGLRREEVAMLAGVSTDYYTRLERGDIGNASRSVLEGIARALQLDDVERDHLFDLARNATSDATGHDDTPRSGSVRASVQRLLDNMQVPPSSTTPTRTWWPRTCWAERCSHRSSRPSDRTWPASSSSTPARPTSTRTGRWRAA